MINRAEKATVMVSPQRLYYCASLLLYGALANEYLLYDPQDIRVPNNTKPRVPDARTFHDVMVWGHSQALLIPEEVVTDIGPEPWMDEFTEQHIPPIWEKARQAHREFPRIKGWQWLSFLYCQTAAAILREFQRIMESEPMPASPYYLHYAEQAERIEGLRQALVAHRPQKDHAQIASLLDEQAQAASRIWREQVMTTAARSEQG